jgi:NADH:ubiquinone oxidoreductase subunit 4 (subunit M)
MFPQIVRFIYFFASIKTIIPIFFLTIYSCDNCIRTHFSTQEVLVCVVFFFLLIFFGVAPRPLFLLIQNDADV